MNRKIKAGNGGTFILNDRNYKASGGEADIYVNGGRVFKVYHDSNKILQPKKLQELAVINNPHVVIPKDLIFDASTVQPLGYIADFVDNAEPLLKLFTRTFKNDNRISPAMIN